MRKSYLLLAGVALMSAFTACSNEEDIPQAAQANGSELVIKNVGVAEVGTKAGIRGNAFADGAQLAIFLNSGDLGSSYNASGDFKETTNILFEKSAGAWQWTGGTIMLSNTVGTVRAYYPYADGNKTQDGTAIPVTVAAEQTSISTGTTDVSDQKDYMYAEAVSNISNASGKSTIGTLTMKHALAMVTFEIANSSTTPYKGAGKISSIKLYNNAPESKAVIQTGDGTMNINDGSISIGSPVTAGVTTNIAEGSQNFLNKTNEANPELVPHILIKPYTEDGGFAQGDVKVSFVIDGATYILGLPAIASGYEAGKNYVYSFTLAGTQLEITSVEITDWTKESQDGGTIKQPEA